MPLTVALTAAAGASGANNGPLPPTYAGSAYGFFLAAATPNGASAGSISHANYFDAPIAAIATDSHLSPSFLIVALEGTYDQTYIGTVTHTDGVHTFDPAQAVYAQYLIGSNTITSWVWPCTTALTSANFIIGDSADTFLTLTGTSQSSTEIQLAWSSTLGLPSNYYLYRGIAGAAPTLYQTLAGSATGYDDTGLSASTQYQYYLKATFSDSTTTQSTQITLYTPASGVSAAFNCDCDAQALPGARTLADLRKSILIRAGYAAQATNPPPGMKDLINDILQDSQRQLYRQHKEIQTTRMYAWQMQINQRYYGITADESGCRSLDPYSVEWVGFEDLNQAWYTLIQGINPLLYTRAQISTGWPTHYEIRSCIEVFPAPKAPYTLWIKGRFGLDPFVADTDVTTIDSQAVFLLALGLVKSHYRQQDAQMYLTQADNYTKYLVAGSHQTARYVPRTHVQRPLTPPNFLPVDPGYTGP